jgi:hypothetical protein
MIEIDGESQARDRERLEGERLRAEFNSPMNRDAQRFLGRRFKRASDAPVQVGMFEETPEPDQRRLF